MSDHTNDTTPTGPPGEVRLTIVLNMHGNIGIEGPINNKILCYGMLEAAKDAIKAYEARQQRIVPAMQLPPEFRQ